MTVGTILLVIVILLLLGAFPGFGLGYNHSWGYGPSGILGVVLVVVIVLMLMGRL